MLNIVLPKADYSAKEIIWEALLADGQYKPDPITLLEMRKKIDLEHFQIEVIEHFFITSMYPFPRTCKLFDIF